MQRILVCLALSGLAGSASADVVAYWAFPGTAPAQNFNISWPIPADLTANVGPATIDTDAPKYDGSPSPTALQQGSMQYFTGTTVNAQPGFLAGQALSMRNDSQDRGQNKSLFVRFDATNFQGLRLSYAERYSSTGPANVSISYSTDGGGSYIPFSGYTTVRDGSFAAAARVIDLSSATGLNGLANAYVKITFSAFNALSNGSARVDNLTIEGTLVPAPGGLLLAGLGGLLAVRRRR